MEYLYLNLNNSRIHCIFKVNRPIYEKYTQTHKKNPIHIPHYWNRNFGNIKYTLRLFEEYFNYLTEVIIVIHFVRDTRYRREVHFKKNELFT